MILDKNGNPIPKAPKFGQFHIPNDARVKFEAAPAGGQGQTLTWYWRTPSEEVRTYCQRSTDGGHGHE